MQKLLDFIFNQNLLYLVQSIDFIGNFRIWNRFFPKWEFGGGDNLVLFIRALSGKNSRLTKVPFWNCTAGIFHFIGRMLIEDRFSYSECISCYRIAKYACESAEIRPREPASGDDSKSRHGVAFADAAFLFS